MVAAIIAFSDLNQADSLFYKLFGSLGISVWVNWEFLGPSTSQGPLKAPSLLSFSFNYNDNGCNAISPIFKIV